MSFRMTRSVVEGRRFCVFMFVDQDAMRSQQAIGFFLDDRVALARAGTVADPSVMPIADCRLRHLRQQCLRVTQQHVLQGAGAIEFGVRLAMCAGVRTTLAQAV
jgi:hypothetical protein